MSTPDPARRRWAVLEVAAPATLAAVAAAATPLPWWRADRGAVLLGAGPVTELPPDTWTGVEMIGPWAAAVAVPAGIAVLAAALAILGSIRAERPMRPVPMGGVGRVARGRRTVGGGCGRSRGRRRRGARAPGVGRVGGGRGVACARGRTRGSGRRASPERGDARRVARFRPPSCAFRHGGFRVPAHTVAGRHGRGVGRRGRRPARRGSGRRPTAPGRGRTVRAGRRRRRVSPAQRRGRARRGGRRVGRCSPTARPGWSAGPASSSRTRTAGRACSPGPTVARPRRSGWSATGSCTGPRPTPSRSPSCGPGHRWTSSCAASRRRARSAPTARCGCVRTPTRWVPSAVWTSPASTDSSGSRSPTSPSSRSRNPTRPSISGPCCPFPAGACGPSPEAGGWRC